MSYYHFYVNNDVIMTSLCQNDVIDDVIDWVGTRPSATRGRSLFFKVKESELLRVQSVVCIKCSVVRIKCRHRQTDTHDKTLPNFPTPLHLLVLGGTK